VCTKSEMQTQQRIAEAGQNGDDKIKFTTNPTNPTII
jgi:hypothetical protein